MRNSIIKFLAKAILMSVVMVFSTSVFAGYVDLIVTGAGASTMLKIDDSDVRCGADKNCIQTTKGSALDLDFKLDQACKGAGPNYKLSGMQFSMIQSQPDPANPALMKKAFGDYNLPAIVVQDFDTETDGTVKWDNTAGNNNKLHDDKIKIRDNNEGEYVVFFQIEASKCDEELPGPDVIFLDPRVENTGR